MTKLDSTCGSEATEKKADQETQSDTSHPVVQWSQRWWWKLLTSWIIDFDSHSYLTINAKHFRGCDFIPKLYSFKSGWMKIS